MVFFKVAKKGIELSKVAAEYGIERAKQKNDPELLDLGLELGKKWVYIADDKANKVMDKALDSANAKLEEVKNGEDKISRKQEEAKDHLRDAIDKSEEKIENPDFGEEDSSLLRKQKDEIDELKAKHYEELKALHEKQKQEQKEAIKSKKESLKDKTSDAKDYVSDKKTQVKEEAKDLKDQAKSAKDDVKADIKDARAERKEAKANKKEAEESDNENNDKEE